MEAKIALITGGGSGIGRATALAFARRGIQTVISDVNVAGGEETVDLMRGAGGDGCFVRADVSQADDVAALVQAVIETYGRLDYAVNNAGISGGLVSRLHEVDESVFDQIIAINLKGVWLCMKYELPVMLQNGGVIVNLASVAGLIGAPKGAAYAASKHGVVGLTRTAALEYAKYNIRVNAVCPSYTNTPMVSDITDSDPVMERLTVNASPMKRLGKPEEIADAISWLCSDQATFVNGMALAVDGGLTAM